MYYCQYFFWTIHTYPYSISNISEYSNANIKLFYTHTFLVISNLTVENEVVLDPFLGGGTTAIAALKLNRKIIGTEIQEDAFNMAENRIAEFLSSKTSYTEEDKNRILAEYIEENGIDNAITELLSSV